MTPATSLSYIFFSVILVEIILVIATKSEFSIQHNATNYTPWKSARRSKRSLYDKMPDQLDLKIKCATGEEIELHWMKKDRHLANEHLPISTTLPMSMSNVMTNIGEFVIYRDVEKSSAVVYFENLNAFYGVIGMDYSIKGLPLEFDEHGKYSLGTIDEPYVRKRDNSFRHIYPDNDALKNYLASNDHLNRGIKRPSDGEPGPSSKYQRTEQNSNEILNEEEVHMKEYTFSNIRNGNIYSLYKEYYLETVIFVTHDIAELYKLHFGEDHYVEWIVRDYIIYFNAIDMAFETLSIENGKFFINIASITIEDNLLPFDFMMSNGVLHFNDMTMRLPHYLYLHRFMPDSFDYVFIHARPLISQELFMNNGKEHRCGLTKCGADLFEARKSNRFFDAVPISLIGFEYDYANYAVAVHEIALILNMRIDSPEGGLKSMDRCHSIMQRGGPKCDHCFKWSDDSQRQFKKFFRGNRNRCFFLNQPRSLRPPGERFKDLTPYEQCQCFGYPSNARSCKGSLISQVGVHGCSKPLQCQEVDGKQSISTVRPIDGTKCAYKKVCWNGVCVKT